MTQRKWITRLLIGGIFSLGFFFTLIFLLYREIPQANRDVLITLLGFLGGSVTTVVAFYFGDSEGGEGG